jgi:hypothetical protein
MAAPNIEITKHWSDSSETIGYAEGKLDGVSLRLHGWLANYLAPFSLILGWIQPPLKRDPSQKI